MSLSADYSRKGFTLIELLVVIAIIAILAALLFPVMGRAKLSAQVSRVQSDLRQLSLAIQMYEEDNKGLPPVRSSCENNLVTNYYEAPRELVRMQYLPEERFFDPFNKTADPDGHMGKPYKYVAINWGYSNGTITEFTMWIPRDYPQNREPSILYFREGGQVFSFDGGSIQPAEPPVTWAVWSVGPGGDPGWIAAGNRMLPAPRSEWYPFNRRGVVTRFSDGRASPG